MLNIVLILLGEGGNLCWLHVVSPIYHYLNIALCDGVILHILDSLKYYHIVTSIWLLLGLICHSREMSLR